jgi:phospholipid/cholesterol/gamma-HCH transport system permease protein
VINRLLQKVGSSTLALCTTLGIFTLFFVKSVKVLCTTRLKWHKLFEQINRIGVDSFYIVVLTGTFSGMVFALQSYIGFQRVGGEQFIGAVVALGMIRELGPVLTGLMVTGRAGSAIAAELGTMSISEQIDALVTLRINPFQYLIVPRILAGTMALPFLAIFSMICGIMGGYVLCVYILHLSPEDYLSNIKTYVELSDIKSGLIKASFFGLILSTVGAYKGYNTTGGAKGVGLSTTQSVVIASIFILISNYFLTKLLEHL